MHKKILALLLAVSTMITSISVPVMAEEIVEAEENIGRSESSARQNYYKLVEYIKNNTDMDSNYYYADDMGYEEYEITYDFNLGRLLDPEEYIDGEHNAVRFQYHHMTTDSKKCDDKLFVFYYKRGIYEDNMLRVCISLDAEASEPTVWDNTVVPKTDNGTNYDEIYVWLEQNVPALAGIEYGYTGVSLGEVRMEHHDPFGKNFALQRNTDFKRITVVAKGEEPNYSDGMYDYSKVDFSSTNLKNKAKNMYLSAYDDISSLLKEIYGEEDAEICDLIKHGNPRIPAPIVIYNINYELNGGECLTDLLTRYPSNKKKYTLPTSKKVKKTGYVFKGWTDAADRKYKYLRKSTAFDGLTLFANWSPNKYTITYKMTRPARGVTAPRIPKVYSDYDTDTYLAADITAEDKNGVQYVVTGWKTKKRATDASYMVGEYVTGTFGTKNKQKITLYPVWETVTAEE